MTAALSNRMPGRGAATSGYVAERDSLHGIAILLVMIHRMYPHAGGTSWPIEAGSLVLLAFEHRDRAVTAILRTAPLRHMGKLGFGLYLLHRPADTLVTASIAHARPNETSLAWIPVKIEVAFGPRDRVVANHQATVPSLCAQTGVEPAGSSRAISQSARIYSGQRQSVYDTREWP